MSNGRPVQIVIDLIDKAELLSQQGSPEKACLMYLSALEFLDEKMNGQMMHFIQMKLAYCYAAAGHPEFAEAAAKEGCKLLTDDTDSRAVYSMFMQFVDAQDGSPSCLTAEQEKYLALAESAQLTQN